jgi:2-oxoglutarate dehydrogenase E2 component (dihydrolipoamide succinyltransferase)
VPSSAEGTLQEVLFNVNDVVPVGAVIARISTSAEEETAPAPPIPEMPRQSSQQAAVSEPRPLSSYNKPESKPAGNANRFYSPLVLNIAASEGVSMSELETITGTGNEGRVTKRDILQYVSDRKSGNGFAKAEVVTGPQSYERTQPYETPAPKQYSAPVYSTWLKAFIPVLMLQASQKPM